MSTSMYKHMHNQIVCLKAPYAHIYVRIRKKHKQAKKRAALRVQKHCAGIPWVGIEPRTSHSRGKTVGIKPPAQIRSTRCDRFTWWWKTHVFECQPPNWGWAGYEFRYKFSISQCNTTQYHCNYSDPNHHCNYSKSASRITVRLCAVAITVKARWFDTKFCRCL